MFLHAFKALQIYLCPSSTGLSLPPSLLGWRRTTAPSLLSSMSRTLISLSTLSSVNGFLVLKILVPNGIILIHGDWTAVCVAMEKLQALATSRGNWMQNVDSLGLGLCTTASRSGTKKSNAPEGVHPSLSQPRHGVCPLIPPTQVPSKFCI
jgi:hypothetical protein